MRKSDSGEGKSRAFTRLLCAVFRPFRFVINELPDRLQPTFIRINGGSNRPIFPFLILSFIDVEC